MSLEVKTICELVRDMETNDASGETTLSKFVKQNMRDDINKSEAYYNSQFTTPKFDANGRPKPFKNISYPAVNIWYRATSRTPNSLYFKASSNEEQIPALLATIKLHEWMEKIHFGQFLNKWGHELAKHGSSPVEIVEKGKELTIRPLDWNTIKVDPIDFNGNIKIKELWYTPAQLKQNKNYDQDMVDHLLGTLEVRETADGEKRDSKAGYIKVQEVQGNLPLVYLTGKKGDEEEFVEQFHVVSFQAKKNNPNEYNEFCLYSGRLKKPTMVLTHLIDQEGQTYVGGAVKNLFEAQWMVNDSEKMMRDQLLIASKIFFQGSDEAMTGKSFFSNVDNGEYLHHKAGEPMTRVSTSPDISALQSWQERWQQFGNQVNGIADAMTQQAKAGTAWRQVQAQLIEAHSLFEKMGQTKDLYLKQIMNEYVLPFFKKQLIGDSSPIAKILEAHEIKQIDTKYLPAEINRRLEKRKKDTILSGNIYTPEMESQDTAEISQQLQGELAGNQRFISPKEVDWATELENLSWDLEFITESDSQDIQQQMATYQTALNFLISLQGRPMTDDEQMIFNNLVSLTGTISPLQLNQGAKAPASPMAMPLNQPQPMMVGGQ